MKPVGSTCSTGTPTRRALSKAKAAFLSPATTTSSRGKASRSACRFVPEPEASTAKRDPSGNRSAKLGAPSLDYFADAPRRASRTTERLQSLISFPCGHDGAEDYAQVEDAAHLALGDVAEGPDQGEHRRLIPR